MITNPKKTAFRMLFLITTPKLTKKAVNLFDEGNIPIQYHCRAQGTASNEIMDILGLGGIEKNILMTILPKFFADKMLTKLQKHLHLGTPNSGIAFTIALSGGNSRILKLTEAAQSADGATIPERDENEMTESEYTMIMVIVNQGFSEEVMDAAKPMGATGGTVFHSRQVGNEETMKFWGISVQHEREIVLILSAKENKLSIMKAIGEKCGMQTEANGVILSFPVDGVAGMD